MNKKYTILTLGLLTTLSLSACTDTTPTNTNPSNTQSSTSETTDKTIAFNSCNLLETTDIQEIFPGATVKITQQGDESNPIGQRICFYDASEEEMKFVQTSLIRTVDMSSSLSASGQTAKSIFLNGKELVEEPESVAGVGAEAYFGGSGLTPGAGLNILVNDNTSINITVGLGFGNDDQNAHLDAEKALAAKILPKL